MVADPVETAALRHYLKKKHFMITAVCIYLDYQRRYNFLRLLHVRLLTFRIFLRLFPNSDIKRPNVRPGGGRSNHFNLSIKFQAVTSDFS